MVGWSRGALLGRMGPVLRSLATLNSLPLQLHLLMSLSGRVTSMSFLDVADIVLRALCSKVDGHSDKVADLSVEWNISRYLDAGD